MDAEAHFVTPPQDLSKPGIWGHPPQWSPIPRLIQQVGVALQASGHDPDDFKDVRTLEGLGPEAYDGRGELAKLRAVGGGQVQGPRGVVAVAPGQAGERRIDRDGEFRLVEHAPDGVQQALLLRGRWWLARIDGC